MSTRIANTISLISILLLAAYVAWMYAALPDPMPKIGRASCRERV